MKTLLPATLSVALSMSGAGLSEAAEPDGTLAEGAIVTQEAPDDDGGGSARMQILVHASPRAIWDVIISCDLAFVFVEGLQKCEVLEEQPGRALVHQVVKPGWPMSSLDYVFESRREPYHRIEFELVRGNLKAMDGSWNFSEQGDATLVDYEVHVQPGIPVPRFLVRHNLKGSMPDLLACIRSLAGGSGDEGGERADRKRCAGPAAARD